MTISQTFKFACIYAICFLIPILTSYRVTVNCSERYIDIVVKEAKGFYGQIIGGNSSKRCSVVGDGRPEVHLQIMTDVANRDRCKMVEHENAFVTTIHVRQIKHLDLKEDSYFIVRCPTQNPNINLNKPEKESMPAGTLVLNDDNPTVGDNYNVKLEIPLLKEVGRNIQIGPCIAFVGGNDDLRVLQLVDEHGCPTAQEIPHSFTLNETLKNATNMEYSTKMKMFSFGDNDHFYLQCQLSKCANNCTTTNCSEHVQNRPQVRTSPNPRTSLTSMRIDVSNRTDSLLESHCEKETQFSTTIYVSLTILLTSLTMLVWSAAVIGIRREKNIQLSCFSVESIVELVAASRRRSGSSNNSAHTRTSTVNTTIYQNLPRSPLRLTFLDRLPEPPVITIEKLKELNNAFNNGPSVVIKNNDTKSQLSASRSTLDFPILKSPSQKENHVWSE